MKRLADMFGVGRSTSELLPGYGGKHRSSVNRVLEINCLTVSGVCAVQYAENWSVAVWDQDINPCGVKAEALRRRASSLIQRNFLPNMHSISCTPIGTSLGAGRISVGQFTGAV
jgi:hypothetical protein